MKKIIILLIMISLTASCLGLGKIKIKDDEFNDSQVVSLSFKHASMEKIGHIFKRNISVYAHYVRNIKKNKSAPSSIKVSFNVDNNVSNLVKRSEVKVGTKKYRVRVIEVSNQIQQQTNFTGNTTYSNNSSNKGVDAKTTISGQTSTWKAINGRIKLSKNIEKAILECDKFYIRFYLGSDSLTLKIYGEELKKIKEFLEVGSLQSVHFNSKSNGYKNDRKDNTDIKVNKKIKNLKKNDHIEDGDYDE